MTVLNSLVVVFLTLNALIGSTSAFASPAHVDLGSCTPFAVTAGTTVTNAGPTVLNGDLALFPGTAVTGFPLGEIVGNMYLGDATAQACIGDLHTAITTTNGLPADALMSGELGGMTLPPGVYKSDAGFAVTGILTLDGQNKRDAAWIFIMASTLVVNVDSKVQMINYDSVKQGTTNVWWSVGSSASIFTNAVLPGTVMAFTSISAGLGASTGPLLANNGAVTLLTNTVSAYQSGKNEKGPVPSAVTTRAPTKRPSSAAASTKRPSAASTGAPTKKRGGGGGGKPPSAGAGSDSESESQENDNEDKSSGSGSDEKDDKPKHLRGDKVGKGPIA